MGVDEVFAAVGVLLMFAPWVVFFLVLRKDEREAREHMERLTSPQGASRVSDLTGWELEGIAQQVG